MDKNFLEILNNVEDAYFSNTLNESENNSINLVNSTENAVPKSFSDVIDNVYEMYFAKEKNDYAKLVDDMAYKAVKEKAKETFEDAKKRGKEALDKTNKNIKESAKTSGKMFELKNLGKTLVRLGKAKDNEKEVEKKENTKGEMKQGIKDFKKGVDKLIRTKKYYEEHGDKDVAEKGTRNSLKKMGKGKDKVIGGLKKYVANKAHSLNTQGKIVKASYNRLKRGEKELYFSDLLKEIIFSSFNAGARNINFNQYVQCLNNKGLQTSLTQEDFSNIMNYPESRIELMHILD